MKYLISFDIRGKKRDKDRDKLDAFLEEWGAIRVLESQWVLDEDDTDVVEILDTIRQEKSIKLDDGILVCTLSPRLRREGRTAPGYASHGLIDEIV